MMAPQTTKQWTLDEYNGFDSLTLHNAVPIPQLRSNEVLVKIHAASLNYRDLIIAKVSDFVRRLIRATDGSWNRANIDFLANPALFRAQMVPDPSKRSATE